MSVDYIMLVARDDDAADIGGDILTRTAWEDYGGKWQKRVTILRISQEHADEMNACEMDGVKAKPGDYYISEARSGSYWDDFEYEDPVVFEVEAFYEDVPTIKWKKKQ